MELLKDMTKWRQELHQIPELGLQEVKTAAYIEQELVAMGYQPQRILDTGVYVYLDYGRNQTTAFRSDMDALSIHEDTNTEYCSLHSGCMHACGHDGHMAALLGFAKRLKYSKVQFGTNLLLLFQPAEESPGGANLIVQSGLLDQYHVTSIYGMHLMPTIDEGVIACKSGPLMAQNGELDVTIQGQSAHAGLYHQGIDSIVIASQLINEYQTIMSRIISPFQPAVLHIGKIEGGDARNIVAGTTKLEGTIRVFDEDTYHLIASKIEKANQAMEQLYNCTITCTCPPMYPPVLNDEQLYQSFVQCVQTEYQEIQEPYMLAEDFSYYQKAVPGIFFFLGTRSKQYASGLHTQTFNFDEKILEKAVHLYYEIALQK